MVKCVKGLIVTSNSIVFAAWLYKKIEYKYMKHRS